MFALPTVQEDTPASLPKPTKSPSTQRTTQRSIEPQAPVRVSTPTPQKPRYPKPRRNGSYCNDFDSRAQYEDFYSTRTTPSSHDRDGDGVYCEAL